jgi:hypothetical protein
MFGRLLIGLTQSSTRLAFDVAEGLGVSTVDSADCGPETAICTADATIPVERYATREAALEGHAKWLSWVKDRTHTHVLRLGYKDLTEDDVVLIKRRA